MVTLNGSGNPQDCALIALLCAAFINGVSETSFVTPRDIGLVSAAIVFSLVIQPAAQSVAGSMASVWPARHIQLMRTAR
jgi:hypothetical protein